MILEIIVFKKCNLAGKANRKSQTYTELYIGPSFFFSALDPGV